MQKKQVEHAYRWYVMSSHWLAPSPLSQCCETTRDRRSIGLAPESAWFTAPCEHIRSKQRRSLQEICRLYHTCSYYQLVISCWMRYMFAQILRFLSRTCQSVVSFCQTNPLNRPKSE